MSVVRVPTATANAIEALLAQANKLHRRGALLESLCDDLIVDFCNNHQLSTQKYRYDPAQRALIPVQVESSGSDTSETSD